jgi:phytoene dehydrogenase-like protein
MPRDDNYEMTIIGGGLAGLACGALLAKQGHRPLIIEMNEQVGGRALGTKVDGFVYDYFPIGLTPVRGHRLEMLAQELGFDADHFKVKGPSRASYGYRGRSGKWRVLNNVNIVLGSPGELVEPTHLFELWELDQGERLRAIQVLADIFLKSPEQIRKLDDDDISSRTWRWSSPSISFRLPSTSASFRIRSTTAGADTRKGA